MLRQLFLPFRTSVAAEYSAEGPSGRKRSTIHLRSVFDDRGVANKHIAPKENIVEQASDGRPTAGRRPITLPGHPCTTSPTMRAVTEYSPRDPVLSLSRKMNGLHAAMAGRPDTGTSRLRVDS